MVAVALAATSGCASAIVTSKHQVPYAGAKTDLLVTAFCVGAPPAWPFVLAALADLVPSFLLDTLLLPLTISRASETGEWELHPSLP